MVSLKGSMFHLTLDMEAEELKEHFSVRELRPSVGLVAMIIVPSNSIAIRLQHSGNKRYSRVHNGS